MFLLDMKDMVVTVVHDSSFTTGDSNLGAVPDESSTAEVFYDNLAIYTIDS
jgi:hypothetical protein